MANFRVRSTLYESFDTLSDWTSGAGSMAMNGGKLEVTSVSGGNGYATKTISSNFANKSNFKLTIYIADTAALANISAVELFLTSSATFATWFDFVCNVGSLHVGYNEILVAKDAFTTPNGESWANTMVRFRVRVNALASVVATIRFVEMQSDYYSRPKCIIDFDDSRASVYSVAYPYMRKYGFKGSVYVNSGYVDVDGNYMTTAQLRELYDTGWDMANHTDTHPHMNVQTDAYNSNQIDLCASYLLAQGFTRNRMNEHFVYPYGDFNDSVVALVASKGFLTARSTLANRTQANSLDNQYLLLCQSFANNAAPSVLMAAIDRAIRDGGVVRFLFHSLSTPVVTSFDYPIADFQTVMDYLATKKEQIDVVPMTEWYRGLSAASPRKVA